MWAHILTYNTCSSLQPIKRLQRAKVEVRHCQRHKKKDCCDPLCSELRAGCLYVLVCARTENRNTCPQQSAQVTNTQIRLSLLEMGETKHWALTVKNAECSPSVFHTAERNVTVFFTQFKNANMSVYVPPAEYSHNNPPNNPVKEK